jgi:MFS family permease
MLVALIPNVAEGLDTSIERVGIAITAYMIPFAALQLVSGTMAERMGGARLVRLGYLTYGLAAVAAASSPEIWSFVGSRAVMGAANAFLTPILLAALSEAVPAAVLGRSVGTFAAVQVAGITFAPALGGALGEISWRLAFVLVAVVSFALAAHRLALRSRQMEGRASLRMLLNRWNALAAAQGMLGYLGFTGIGLVVALVCSREFGLGSGASGLIVATYGVGGILLGRLGGTATDRAGRTWTALLGVLVCGGFVLGLAFAPNAWSFALVYLGVGCGGAFAWAALNTIVLESFPENRAGSLSAYSAFKFVGVALAPVIYLPLFARDTRMPFLLAASLTVLCAALVLPWFARYRTPPAPPWPEISSRPG